MQKPIARAGSATEAECGGGAAGDLVRGGDRTSGAAQRGRPADLADHRVGIQGTATSGAEPLHQVEVGGGMDTFQCLPGGGLSLGDGCACGEHRAAHRGVALRSLGVAVTRIVLLELLVHVTRHRHRL
jgi:hypothetical protein